MRRRLPPKPPHNPDGMYILDPETGSEVFLTWAELESACKAMMDPSNAFVMAQEFGKIDYRLDPTYNLRKQRK